jgi:hypothetical protein
MSASSVGPASASAAAAGPLRKRKQEPLRFLDRLAGDVIGIIAQQMGPGKDLARLVRVNHLFYDGGHRAAIDRAIQSMWVGQIRGLSHALPLMPFHASARGEVNPFLAPFLRKMDALLQQEKFTAVRELIEGTPPALKPLLEQELNARLKKLKERFRGGWHSPTIIQLFPVNQARKLLCEFLKKPRYWRQRGVNVRDIDALVKIVLQFPTNLRKRPLSLLIAAYIVNRVFPEHHRGLALLIQNFVRKPPQFFCGSCLTISEVVGNFRTSAFHVIVDELSEPDPDYCYGSSMGIEFIRALPCDDSFKKELFNFASLTLRDKITDCIQGGRLALARTNLGMIPPESQPIKDAALRDIEAAEAATEAARPPWWKLWA